MVNKRGLNLRENRDERESREEWRKSNCGWDVLNERIIIAIKCK